jgi:hypothetical protein
MRRDRVVSIVFVTNAVLNGHVNTSDVANIAYRIHIKNDKVSNLADLSIEPKSFSRPIVRAPLLIVAD